MLPRPEFHRRLDVLADVVVLAEDTAQVAVAEEDGSGTVPPAQAVLLTEVREGARHDRVPSGLAGRPCVSQTIHTAVTRTEPAIGERGNGACGAVTQLAAAKSQICRLKLHRCSRFSRQVVRKSQAKIPSITSD